MNDLEVRQKVYIKWTGKWSEIIRIFTIFNLQPVVIIEYFTKENKKSICGYNRNRLLTVDEYRIWNRKRIAREIGK